MRFIWPTSLLLLCAHLHAQTNTPAPTLTDTEAFTAEPEFTAEAMNTCLQASVISAAEAMTVRELKEACELLHEQQTAEAQSTSQTSQQLGQTSQQAPAESYSDVQQQAINKPGDKQIQETPLLTRRMMLEALNRSNRFMLTPHKRNYFFPVSYTSHPNDVPYRATEAEALADLRHTEAEFQLSVKILILEDIIGENGHLYLGYTNHSLWQVYSDSDSAPFRATDHRPEFILSFTNDWELFGFYNRINEFSITHQSNGLGGRLSRSWNRVMLNSVVERGNFTFSLSPWYRIPEPEQEFPGDPHGDDNPDIEHYMGHVEFNAAYQHKDSIFSAMLRNNFDADNKGALELGWSFPLSTNLRGQLKYFNGHGHSLIDYNTDMEIYALGIVFTDLF